MIRNLFLILFIISVVVVYREKDALIYGIQGYLTGEGKSYEIRDPSDLSSLQELFASTVKVVGIPDYKNTCAITGADNHYTCFRILNFSNRLIVCTPKGLETPEAIDEVIKPKTMRGRLIWLDRTAVNKDVRRCLIKTRNISLSQDALILLEGRHTLPSVKKVALLFGCLLLACYSLFRVLRP